MKERSALQQFEYLVGILAYGFWIVASLSLAKLVANAGWYGRTYAGVPPGEPPRLELHLGAYGTAWIIGGFVGVKALWSIVAANPADSQKALRRWQVIGVCTGILVALSVLSRR
jgi:hypothetical protein